MTGENLLLETALVISPLQLVGIRGFLPETHRAPHLLGAQLIHPTRLARIEQHSSNSKLSSEWPSDLQLWA